MAGGGRPTRRSRRSQRGERQDHFLHGDPPMLEAMAQLPLMLVTLGWVDEEEILLCKKVGLEQTFLGKEFLGVAAL